MTSLMEMSLPSIDWLNRAAYEYVFAASILLVLVLLSAFVARHQSAALQHAVWVAGMLGLLILPVTLRWFPKAHIVPRLESSAGMAAARSMGSQSASSEIPILENELLGTSSPEPSFAIESQVEYSTAQQEKSHLSLSAIAILIWAIGTGALSVRMILSMGYLWLLAHRQARKPDESLQRESMYCAKILGLKRPFVLIQHDKVTSPMAFGTFVGRVAVPFSIESQSTPERQSILLHELGHLRRHDPLWNGIVEVAFAILWFHPLVWYARRQSCLTREKACDDAVLAAGVEPTTYACCLLSLVAGSLEPRHLQSVVVSMSTSDRVEERIRAIMDRSRDRRQLGALRMGLMSLLVTGVVVALGSLRMETRTAFAQEPAIANPPASIEPTDGNPLRRIASGRITDPEGAPIARAKMFFEWYSKNKGPQLNQVEVGDDGSFRLEHVLEEPVDDWAYAYVWAFADGYAARAIGFHFVFRQSKVDGIEIRLQKQLPISVEVRLPNDQPCPNALVAPAMIQTCSLTEVDGHFALKETSGLSTFIPFALLHDLGAKSDLQGNATISSFALASFDYVDIHAPGFGQQRFVKAKDKQSFKLAPTGAIAGRVIIDDPTSIEGTVVYIKSYVHGRPQGIAEVTVDDQGKFSIPEIVANSRPKEFYMTWKETLPMHPYYDRTRRDTIPEGGVLEFVIETKRAVKVTGRILTGDTRQPVVGAGAYLNSLDSPLNGVRAFTDEQGYFTLLVCPGPTLQQVTSLGSDRSLQDLYDYPRMDQIDIADDVTELKLEPYLLTPKKVVNGVLRDRSGHGLGGRTVVIHDKTYFHVAGRSVTNPDGSFSMPVKDWKFVAESLGEKGRYRWSIAKGEQVVRGIVDKNYTPLTQIQLDGDNVVLETQ